MRNFVEYFLSKAIEDFVESFFVGLCSSALDTWAAHPELNKSPPGFWRVISLWGVKSNGTLESTLDGLRSREIGLTGLGG